MPPTKEYDFDPRNLPQDLLAAIGLAITCASQTESVLEMAIGGCLGLDSEYTLAASTHMTLPLKFSVLRSAAEIRIDSLDDLDQLDILLDNIDRALGKRHNLAHDGWCRDPHTSTLFRTKYVARTRLQGDLIPVTVDSVREDAKAIYDAGMALMTFLAIRHLMPPIPAQPRPREHKSKAARKKRREQK